MINYKEIEQGSLEWFELKWGKIGGTLSKGLFVKTDTLFLDILSQRIEEFEPNDGFASEAMQHGTENEPFAREYLESYTGLKFNETGWLQSEENELLGVSPDGITEDETTACEIKCLGRKNHLSVLLEDDIPLNHIPQCIHYFTVNPKLTKLYFIAFRAESVKHFIKELTLDSVIDVGFTKKIEVKQFGVKGQPIKSKYNIVKDLKTVKECVDIYKHEAKELLIKIKSNQEDISF